MLGLSSASFPFRTMFVGTCYIHRRPNVHELFTFRVLFVLNRSAPSDCGSLVLTPICACEWNCVWGVGVGVPVWWGSVGVVGGAVSGEEGRGGVRRERVGNTSVLLLFGQHGVFLRNIVFF